jgi:cytochrome P450
MVALIELAVLLLIAWPILRAAAQPALRRAFPGTVGLIAGALLGGGVLAVCLAIWLPSLLHILTGLVIVAALVVLLRARPSFGRSQKLPPGSLWPLPFAYLIDPFFYQKQFDRHGPVFKINQFGIAAGPNPLRGVVQRVCCVDLKGGMKILHDYDQRLIPPPIPPSRFIPKKYIREMSIEDHLHYRTMFASVFTARVVDANAEFMAGHIRSSLLRLAEQSSSNGTVDVAPEAFLTAMTFGVFVHCFLAIGPDDPRFGRLQDLCNIIDVQNRDDRGINRALDECAELFRQKAHELAAGDVGQPPRSFLGEFAHAQPGALDDLSALRNLIFILQISWSDTSGLIVWLFKELSDHPDWTARLSAGIEPDAGNGADKLPLSLRFVKETLRMRQSEYLYRRVLEDIPVNGFVIPKGWLLRVCVRESHRDRAVFDSPDTFNPDRFLTRYYSRADYSTFGASRISCLGEHLALTLGRIFVEQFAATIVTATVRDGPLECRRWHWKPSSKWTVRVRRARCEAIPK